jgi:hypothetical protein
MVVSEECEYNIIHLNFITNERSRVSSITTEDMFFLLETVTVTEGSKVVTLCVNPLLTSGKLLFSCVTSLPHHNTCLHTTFPKMGERKEGLQ